MKYKAIQHEQDVFDRIMGSGLLKATFAKYSELVDLFGQPAEADGYKVDALWVIEFEDGERCPLQPKPVVTIYNWKNGPNYGEDRRVDEITFWHIGGFDEHQAKRLETIITANKWERIK